jgi:hypothetical protein
MLGGQDGCMESVRGRGVAAAGSSTAGSEAKTCSQAQSQAQHHE